MSQVPPRPPYGQWAQFGPGSPAGQPQDAPRPIAPQGVQPRPRRSAKRVLPLIIGLPVAFLFGVGVGLGDDGTTQAAAPVSAETTTTTATVTAPPSTVTAAPESTPTVTETVEFTVTAPPAAEAPVDVPPAAEAPADVPPAAEAPGPPPQEQVQPPPAPNNEAPVYYQNCTAAWNAGAAPVYAGQPGYAPHLDRDGDGIGCERRPS